MKRFIFVNIFILLYTGLLISQDNFSKIPPFNIFIQKIKSNLKTYEVTSVTDIFYENCVLYKDDDFQICFKKNNLYDGSIKSFHFYLLHINSRNELSFLFPKDKNESYSNIINFIDSIKFKLQYKIGEPFGQEKLIVLFSENKTVIDTGATSKPGEINLGINDIIWLIENNPPEQLKQFYYTSFTFQAFEDARQEFENKSKNIKKKKPEKGIEISDNENTKLFYDIPMITILDPLQMENETRGIEIIHPVTQYSYIIKGQTNSKNEVNKVLINNEPSKLKKTNEIQYYFEKEVKLNEGLNVINVEAFTTEDKSSIKTVKIEVKDNSINNDIKFGSKNYLVMIGINNYKNWPKLKCAVKDAIDVAQILFDKYQFSQSDETKLIDETATKINIDNAFRDLIKKVTENDNVLIYYAGHGFYDNVLDEGYWIPVDANSGTTTDYIPNSTIVKYIKALKSKNTLVIADACFSGSLYTTDMRGEKQTYTEKVQRFRSRWIFTSGRLESVADAFQGSTNSPFATFVIKYLQENSETTFPVSSLVQYVKTTVANNSEQTPIAAPLREVGDEGGEFVFFMKK